MNYFGGRRGRLLDIGANDGKTFSNSYALLEAGWCGVLLEPSPRAFQHLSALYKDNDRGICTYNYGIAETSGDKILHESGNFNGKDTIGLLSCIDGVDKERWNGQVTYEEVAARFLTFEEFLKRCEAKNMRTFEFVTIDAEGYDWTILQQIPLHQVRCQCLCIEHNGRLDLMAAYQGYCAGKHGMREIGRNAENIIFARQ